MVKAPEILSRDDGADIAYFRIPGKSPGVVFLTGFKSDMTGGKALALEDLCRRRGQAFLRFDYSGHGASGGGRSRTAPSANGPATSLPHSMN